MFDLVPEEKSRFEGFEIQYEVDGASKAVNCDRKKPKQKH